MVVVNILDIVKSKLMTSKKGEVQIYIMIIGVLLLIFMVGAYITERLLIEVKVDTLKSKVDAANLAVYKDIDGDELGTSGNIVFISGKLSSALNTYLYYVQDNLGLDNTLTPIDNQSFIDGPVKMIDLRLYSVVNGLTTEYDLNTSDYSWTKVKDNAPDVLITPNNRIVDKTSVYSKVRVKMNILLKMDDADRTIDIPSYTDAVK